MVVTNRLKDKNRNQPWQRKQNNQMEAVIKAKPMEGDIRTSQGKSDMLANMTRKNELVQYFHLHSFFQLSFFHFLI